MAGVELTPRETAIWDQLAVELDGGRAQADRRRRRAARRQLLMAVLLLAALIMLVAGSFAGSELLAWTGVIAWVSAVLIISHHSGHGPRVPMGWILSFGSCRATTQHPCGAGSAGSASPPGAGDIAG